MVRGLHAFGLRYVAKYLTVPTILALYCWTYCSGGYVRGYPWMGWLASHWSPLEMRPTSTKPFTGRSLALSVGVPDSFPLVGPLISPFCLVVPQWAGCSGPPQWWVDGEPRQLSHSSSPFYVVAHRTGRYSSLPMSSCYRSLRQSSCWPTSCSSANRESRGHSSSHRQEVGPVQWYLAAGLH